MAETATTAERLESAPEICALYEPEPAVLAIARDGATPAQCVEQLTADKNLLEAIGFMARWLTKREAVWWCSCLWQSRRPQMQANSESLLQAIVQWVLDPSEERRQQVPHSPKRSRKPSLSPRWPWHCLPRMEVSLCRDQPEVLPPPDLTAQLIASMMRMVATRVPNYRRDQAYQQFLRLGLEVIAGSSHWEDPSEN